MTAMLLLLLPAAHANAPFTGETLMPTPTPGAVGDAGEFRNSGQTLMNKIGPWLGTATMFMPPKAIKSTIGTWAEFTGGQTFGRQMDKITGAHRYDFPRKGRLESENFHTQGVQPFENQEYWNLMYKDRMKQVGAAGMAFPEQMKVIPNMGMMLHQGALPIGMRVAFLMPSALKTTPNLGQNPMMMPMRMKLMEPWTPIRAINPNPQYPRSDLIDKVSEIVSPYQGPLPTKLNNEDKDKKDKFKYEGSVMSEPTVRNYINDIHLDNDFKMSKTNGKGKEMLDAMKWPGAVSKTVQTQFHTGTSALHEGTASNPLHWWKQMPVPNYMHSERQAEPTPDPGYKDMTPEERMDRHINAMN